MRHRLLVTSLVLLLAAIVAVSANAGKPSSTTATTTITDNGACSFTVTYTWSGFSGTGLEAELALGYKALGGADVFLAWTRVPNQAGSGSVSATFTLTGTPTSSHQYLGTGNLLKPSKKYPSGLTAVANAAARRATSGYKPAARLSRSRRASARRPRAPESSARGRAAARALYFERGSPKAEPAANGVARALSRRELAEPDPVRTDHARARKDAGVMETLGRLRKGRRRWSSPN